MSTGSITAQNINGKWAGEYVHNMEGPEVLHIPPTTFIVMLTALGNELSGIWKEDNITALAPGDIVVKGKFEGNEISFTKQYPYTVLRTKEGKGYVSFLRKENPTHYTGSYHEETKMFTGVWEMTWPVYNRIPIIRLFIPPRRFKVTGTWSMKRA